MGRHGRRYRRIAAACAAAVAAVAAAPAAAAPPEVSSLGLPDVRVEGLAELTLAARDPDAAINGVAVDFGDGEEYTAELACRRTSGGAQPRVGPFAPGTELGFEVPYHFTRAGLHTLTVEVTSGACQGTPETVRRTLLVTVLPGLPQVPPIPPLPKIPGLPPLPATPALLRQAAAAQGGCPGHSLRPSRANLLQVRAATLCLINAVRGVRGLRRLSPHRALNIAAGIHSRDMIRRRYFAHEAPGGPRLGLRVLRARYVLARRPWTVGENLAIGTGTLSTPLRTVIAWMLSPTHRANMLSPRYREAGIGPAVGVPGRPRAGGTYTADFGRRG